MYVIHLGFSGYPNHSAGASRVALTFKGLRELGFYVLIINKHSISQHSYPRVSRKGGIPFVFTSKKINRPAGFIQRNLNKVSGLLGEMLLLKKKRKSIHTAVLYSPYFADLVYYRLLSKLFGFSLIVQFVEMRSSLPYRQGYLTNLNDRLFEKYVATLSDGVIAISSLLFDHVKNNKPAAKLIKLPVVCDFNEFNIPIPDKAPSGYLMYCGSIAYLEVVAFILNLYVELKKNQMFENDLVLVISGKDESEFKELRQMVVESGYKDNIHIRSNIPYVDLVTLYKCAGILAIPLRRNMQDTARFPHKIGEYTAAGKPILSTKVGELDIYFEDGVNAILADDYSVDAYKRKFQDGVLDKQKLESIGANSHKLGAAHFHYQAQALTLKAFIEDPEMRGWIKK